MIFEIADNVCLNSLELPLVCIQLGQKAV